MSKIKNNLRLLYFISLQVGFDPLALYRFVHGIPFYYKNYRQLKKQLQGQTEFIFGNFYPILGEKNLESGTMRGAYFYQDLLIAKRIFENKPVRHIDIGSRTDGFVAHVASYREIEIFDIRPQTCAIKNIVINQMDLMLLPEHLINSCDSISSLHAIEHFGLGRYGDPINANGHIKAIENIFALLKPNGKFYFSVPIGMQRIEFNAHRVFSIRYLLHLFDNKFTIDFFHYVNDKGDLFENAVLTEDSIGNNFNCRYGCGIFELSKTQIND